MNVSRRSLLTAAAAAPLARLAQAVPSLPEAGEAIQTGSGPYTLPPLPYAYDALEKAIDKETMTLHHDKHHATYVKNLNDAVAKLPAEWKDKPLEELLANLGKLPEEERVAIRNNGGGHDNHSIFWTIMSPTGGGDPTGRIKEIIDTDFGGFEAFKTKFNDLGARRFGSGWVWLVRNKEGKYELISRPNQDSPRMIGAAPILGNDVWEHAYYLRYQNRRADYLKAWWSVVDWGKVNERIAAAEAAP